MLYVMEKNNFYTWFIVALIWGACIKFIYISPLDEIAIALYVLFLCASKNRIALNTEPIVLVILIMIFYGFMGVYEINSLNSWRYLIIFLISLAFFQIKSTEIKLNEKIISTTSIILLAVSCAIPIFWNVMGWETASYQNYIWSGTAYSAIALSFACFLVLSLSRKFYLKALVLFLLFLSAMLHDTRFGLILAFFLLSYWPVSGARPNYKAFILTSLTISIIVVGSHLLKTAERDLKTAERDRGESEITSTESEITSTESEIASAILKVNSQVAKNPILNVPIYRAASVVSGVTEINNPAFKASYDRHQQISNFLEEVKLDYNKYLFGHGVLTHQRGVADILYQGQGFHKVRPVGIVAMLYDYGIVPLTIIALLLIYSVTSILTPLTFNSAYKWTFLGLLCGSAILINVQEMVLFIIFFSKTFQNLTLRTSTQ